jgi:hypothetical protein
VCRGAALCPVACCPLFAAVSFEREQLLFAAAGLLLFAAVCAVLLRRARAFRAAGAGRVAALSLVAVDRKSVV